jgi:hypothetical protein
VQPFSLRAVSVATTTTIREAGRVVVSVDEGVYVGEAFALREKRPKRGRKDSLHGTSNVE